MHSLYITVDAVCDAAALRRLTQRMFRTAGGEGGVSLREMEPRTRQAREV
jgi:hypothetical protein